MQELVAPMWLVQKWYAHRLEQQLGRFRNSPPVSWTVAMAWRLNNRWLRELRARYRARWDRTNHARDHTDHARAGPRGRARA